jgi:hypothetical protein
MSSGHGQRPAFYASGPGPWRDWWTVLHPPYTAWHLSYVVIGASLAPHVDVARMLATVLAFFAAVGVAAHALDELHGRPLRTHIPTAALNAATVIGLAIAVGLGVVGVTRVGAVLIPFIVIGPVLVAGYNLELLGGRLHTDIGFALAWGAFPLLTSYVAQTGTVRLGALLASGAAFGISYAQRSLSTPARMVRRRTRRVEGTIVRDDGSMEPITELSLLAPLERALRSLSWAMVAFAAAFAVTRLT